MIVALHMCGPEGETMRRQLSQALNTLKQDNRYVINAMLNAGMDVPDTMVEADLSYVPSQHEFNGNGESTQHFYGMKRMFEMGTFSCGDAAAYEAAVMEEKYGMPTEVLSVPLADNDYHGVYVSSDGVIDPTENWLRHWEAALTGQALPEGTPTRTPVAPGQNLGANCRIVDGKVNCDVEGSSEGCCVDARTGRWRCGNEYLDKTPVQIQEVFQGQSTNQRWAKTVDGVFVPICVGRAA